MPAALLHLYLKLLKLLRLEHGIFIITIRCVIKWKFRPKKKIKDSWQEQFTERPNLQISPLKCVGQEFLVNNQLIIKIILHLK